MKSLYKTFLVCSGIIGALAVAKLVSKPMQLPFLAINIKGKSDNGNIATKSGRLTISFLEGSGQGVSAEIFSWGVANMICLGCMKCGTTTLLTILRGTKNHSIIPSDEELHFFDRFWPHGWDNSQDMAPAIRSYAERWQHQSSNLDKTVRLEKTPKYIYGYEVPWRMAKMYGALRTDLKLFAILRDPIDRAVSGYFHERKELDRAVVEQSIDEDLFSALGILEECYGIITLHKKKCPTFEEEALRQKVFATCAVNALPENCEGCSDQSTMITRALELSSVLERGVYVDQVQRYLCAGFSAHNLLILPFTKFTSLSPDQVVEVLESFKDGTDIDMPLHKHLDKKINSRTRDFVLSESTRQRLQEFFDPWNKRLGQFFVEAGIPHDTAAVF
jgi:hypothetical protein